MRPQMLAESFRKTVRKTVPNYLQAVGAKTFDKLFGTKRHRVFLRWDLTVIAGADSNSGPLPNSSVRPVSRFSHD